MTCPVYLSEDIHRTGRQIVRCHGCEKWGLLPPSGNINDLRLPCPNVAVRRGVGDELHSIFGSLGITPTASCQCAARIAAMNRRGVEGCRQTKAEILGWLKEAYRESNVLKRVRAGANAVAQGLPTTLEGLLDLAIERAEGKAESK